MHARLNKEKYMNSGELLSDAFGRVNGTLHRAIEPLGLDALSYRPHEYSNSIAWLAWHITRGHDDHLSEIAGREQAWVVDGWADRFGTTPENGLDDLNFRVAGSQGAFEWLAVLHRFDSATAGLSYGSELDLRALWHSPWKQTFALDASIYNADQFSRDATKIWFWTSYDL